LVSMPRPVAKPVIYLRLLAIPVIVVSTAIVPTMYISRDWVRTVRYAITPMPGSSGILITTKPRSSSGMHTLSCIAIPVTANPGKNPSPATMTGGVSIVIVETIFTRDNSVTAVTGATMKRISTS
jgi:hypothetical protein